MFSHTFLLFQSLLLEFLLNCYRTYYFLSASTSYMRPHVSSTELVGVSFLFTKILELTLSCFSQATQYSPSRKSPEDPKLVNKG